MWKMRSWKRNWFACEYQSVDAYNVYLLYGMVCFFVLDALYEFRTTNFCWNVYINANCPNRATISFFYHQRNKKHTNVIANYNAWGMGIKEIDS